MTTCHLYMILENLNKLKKLKYLNLAINNIEVVENLGRCESLEKLDLTLNFIGNIESVCSLKENRNLKHLYLTGNPCADYMRYREYVIANVIQITDLDNKEVTRTERIKVKSKNYYLKHREHYIITMCIVHTLPFCTFIIFIIFYTLLSEHQIIYNSI